MLIDTHAHIYTTDFTDDRDTVIAEAVKNGVCKIIMPNIDAASVSDVVQAAGRYPGICYPLMGLHPSSVNLNYRQELNSVGDWLSKYPFYGIGEIGMDLYWDRSFRAEQEDAFRQQLKMARSCKLPVVIHVRESFQEVCSILEEEQDGSLTGIFHCFSGNGSNAAKIVDLGFYLGIGGVVTYKNSHLPETLKHVDVKNLVLETDAPWLSPVPRRGKRNESSFLIYTAQKVAEIYGLSSEEVAAVTTRNARELFHI